MRVGLRKAQKLIRQRLQAEGDAPVSEQQRGGTGALLGRGSARATDGRDA